MYQVFHSVEEGVQPMRVIRIDDEVWAALQKRARAFEDTPNSALRRELRIDKRNGKRKVSERSPKGIKTPQPAFREPILRVLYEAGGSARIADVCDGIEQMIGERFNETDRGLLGAGEVRWRNTSQWERNAMVKEGLLKKNSPRGLWELTAKGVAAAEALAKS